MTTIQELTAAKDYLERAYAILRVAKSEHAEDLQNNIVAIQNDITQLMLADFVRAGLASVQYATKDIDGVTHIIVRAA